MVDASFLVQLAIAARDEEAKGELAWWYLSFADEAGFNGAILVQAFGPLTARITVANLGLSPGGEMLAVQVPEEGPLPAESYRNRLLSREELDAAYADDGGVLTIGEMEAGND